jgi:hypothetical protein
MPRAHGAWVAADRAAARDSPAAMPLRTPEVTMSPITATPSSEPTWRVTEMTAEATPACAGGMPETPVLVIGGLTRPSPAPSTASATASHQ